MGLPRILGLPLALLARCAVAQHVTLRFTNNFTESVDIFELDHGYLPEPLTRLEANETITRQSSYGDEFELRWTGEPEQAQIVVHVNGGEDGKVFELQEVRVLGRNAKGEMLARSGDAIDLIAQASMAKRSKCEECLHLGADYCISKNKCAPRGENFCSGPEDHVTADRGFATETGALFLECPKDAELLDGEFIRVHGTIAEKAKTLWTEKLNVREGRIKCSRTPACHGISVEKEPDDEDDEVMVYAKGSADIVHSSWVSYIHVERADAQTRSHHLQKAHVVKASGFLTKTEVMSEEIPVGEAEYTGYVRNIVGKNFDTVTTNPDKDVFVFVYAPWCGWCRQFKPVFNDLAKGLNHVKTLELVQLDNTQNSAGSYDIQAYPTLLLFRAGPRKSEVLAYDGERTPPEMRAWLHTYTTHPFADYPPVTDRDDDDDDDNDDREDL